MDIYEVIFLLQLLVAIGIIGVKLYNLMNQGRLYDMKISFLLFAGFILAWGFALVIMLLSPEELLYSVLFTIETWFLTLNLLTLLGEIIFNIANQHIEITKAYEKRL